MRCHLLPVRLISELSVLSGFEIVGSIHTHQVVPIFSSLNWLRRLLPLRLVSEFYSLVLEERRLFLFFAWVSILVKSEWLLLKSGEMFLDFLFELVFVVAQF